MEKLEQIEVVLEMNERCDIGGAEGRVASIDDSLEVFGGDLGRGDVERHDIVGELGERKVLPALPIGRSRNLLWDVQAAIAGKALQDDVFEGKLVVVN